MPKFLLKKWSLPRFIWRSYAFLLRYAGGYGDVGMAGWYIETTIYNEENLHGCAMPFLSSFGHLSLRTIVHFNLALVRIPLEASTTFSPIFDSLVSSCMLAVVVQHQKLRRCIFHVLVRGIRMATRLTFLLMILAQSVLPKVSGIWVQLSTIC